MTLQILARGLAVWLGFLILASLNGGFREKVLIPLTGDPIGQVLSTLMLCVLILLETWLVWSWLRVPSPRATWWIGTWWLGMTVAFEFLAGHYLFHTPWHDLLSAYNLAQGHTWIFVLLVTFLAPVLTWRLRGNGEKSASLVR